MVGFDAQRFQRSRTQASVVLHRRHFITPRKPRVERQDRLAVVNGFVIEQVSHSAGALEGSTLQIVAPSAPVWIVAERYRQIFAAESDGAAASPSCRRSSG
jgi:hypothetical protein